MTFRKIDEIDAKILKDLLIYGRKPFTEIAKDAGTTKDIIWQHYTRMKKEGIIIGSTIQASYQRLGYISAASIFVTFESGEQNQVLSDILKIPGIEYAFYLGGCEKIWAIADFNRMDEIENVKRTIGKVPSISRVDLDVITGIRNMPENLSVLYANETLRANDTGKQEVGNKVSKTLTKIDETDLKIIEKLAMNGRMSFRKIAGEVNLSTATTARRYTRLRLNGVIRPLIQISLTEIGYSANAFFRLKLIFQSDIDRISEKISKIPDVTGIFKTTGIFDLTLFTNIKSVEQLIELQNEIGGIYGLKEMETIVHGAFDIAPYKKEHLSTF